MADIEKVKKGIKACWSEHWCHKCFDCPYKPDRENDNTCVERLGADVLEQLKDLKNLIDGIIEDDLKKDEEHQEEIEQLKMEGQKMKDNNTVYYEEYLDIVNKPNKEDQDSLVEMAAQECVMQIAANALGNNHVSVEKKDLGNGKTRVTVSMRLVPPEG